MNLTEARLRSWQPRRPSERVKARLFAAPVRRPKIVVWSLRLAPAAASLMVALSVLHHGGGLSGGGFRRETTPEMFASNQAGFLPGNTYQEHNAVYAVTFDWTNRSGSTSSITSFSPGKAN